MKPCVAKSPASPSSKSSSFFFVPGLLAASLTPSVRDIIEKARCESETRTLDELVANVTASFENTDLTNLNSAALPGTIGPGDTATVFSTSATTASDNTDNGAWFAKVARLRGLAPQVGVAPSAQPELARLTYNSLGNPRLLFAGADEADRQRFLLVSLIARSEQLALPAYDSDPAWFDAIWNNEWESRTATLPAYWQSRLTSAGAAECCRSRRTSGVAETVMLVPAGYVPPGVTVPPVPAVVVSTKFVAAKLATTL